MHIYSMKGTKSKREASAKYEYLFFMHDITSSFGIRAVIYLTVAVSPISNSNHKISGLLNENGLRYLRMMCFYT